MKATTANANRLTDDQFEAQEHFDILREKYYEQTCSIDSKESLSLQAVDDEEELGLDYDDAERPDYKLTTPSSDWQHGQEQADSDNHRDEPDEEPKYEPDGDYSDEDYNEDDGYDGEDDNEAYSEEADIDDDGSDDEDYDDDYDEDTFGAI